MDIKIPATITISAPKGTKVISNVDFITLARKNAEGHIEVFTCPSENINMENLHDSDRWTVLTKNELKAIAKKFRIKF